MAISRLPPQMYQITPQRRQRLWAETIALARLKNRHDLGPAFNLSLWLGNMLLTFTWLSSAFLLGLAGGFHCMAMCGNLCAMRFSQQHKQFQVGRAVAYVSVGLVAGGAYWLVAEATTKVIGLKPLLQVLMGLVFANGLYLLITGKGFRVANLRQPVSNQGVSELPVHFKSSRSARSAAALAGASLPLLPCGLFYAAAANATLAGNAFAGGATMAMFVLGSSPWLALGNRVFSIGRRQQAETLSIRIAGLFSAIGALMAIGAGFFNLAICQGF
jgi:uncharacterized protein